MYNEALPFMERGFKINFAIHGEYHPSTASCCEWMSLIYSGLTNQIESQKWKIRAQNIQNVIGEVGERIAD